MLHASAGSGPAVSAAADSGSRLAPFAFVAIALFCLTPYATPGLALALGIGLALSLGNPWQKQIKKTTRGLLQISVVLLGFGMDLSTMLAAARKGFLLAAATILLTFALGALLRHALRLRRSTATLLSAGTAICGGSAIAAVGLAITAAEAEISVALGTVFMLNAVALYLFPPLGHWLGLTQIQFGTWAGIAIHDLSSVVGAASAYGQVALQTATAVKLSRTLWIMPVALLAGLAIPRAVDANGKASRGKVTVPWFVGLFLLASLISTFFPAIHQAAPMLQGAAKTGMKLALLCIGSGMSAAMLRGVGIRPLLHGLALWFVISVVSLGALGLGLN